MSATIRFHASLVPLAVLLLLSGCCETSGEVSGRVGSEAIPGPVDPSCGFGLRYPQTSGEKTNALLELSAAGGRLAFRAELADVRRPGTKVYLLPEPGGTSADVPGFKLHRPELAPRMTRGELRIHNEGTGDLRGDFTFDFEGGSHAEGTFTVCSDPSLDIGAPSSSPDGGGGGSGGGSGDGDDDHWWDDWD